MSLLSPDFTLYSILAGAAFATMIFVPLGLRTRWVQRTRLTRTRESQRVAAELHDDLLQNLQGLILRIESVAVQIATPPAARLQMEELLCCAEGMVIAARDAFQSTDDALAQRGLIPRL